MKKLLSTIVILFLALVSLAPFSVQAQSGRKLITPLCFYKVQQGNPYVQYGTRDANGVPTCPSASTESQILNPTSATSDASVAGICWSRSGTVSNYQYLAIAVSYQVNTSGQPTDCTDIPNFIPRAQFRGTGSVPPTPNPNPNGNTPVPPANNGSTPSNSDSQIADCTDSGFHAVGPLCVPNSPFANSNGIAGTGNVTDLAVKIIRILLFFAGIVAVIMIIIGGYLYMTARGNDAQATNGRKTLVNALIGLAIIILSYIIVQAVYSFLIK